MVFLNENHVTRVAQTVFTTPGVFVFVTSKLAQGVDPSLCESTQIVVYGLIRSISHVFEITVPTQVSLAPQADCDILIYDNPSSSFLCIFKPKVTYHSNGAVYKAATNNTRVHFHKNLFSDHFHFLFSQLP